MQSYYISADPVENQLSGVSLLYLNSYYSTLQANFQTYPGALRYASTTPAQMNLVVQPDEKLVVVFYARAGFKSLTSIKNMDYYPCTSNIKIKCQYFQGLQGDIKQLYTTDHIVVTFDDTSYATTKFHIILPDMQITNSYNYFWYHLGVYNTITKDYSFDYSGTFYRSSGNWASSLTSDANFYADIVGKAGSYKNSVAVYVDNPAISTGGLSYIMICTQWSLFENGISALSASTLAMATPATFSGIEEKSPLALYVDNGMYLTVIPLYYVAGTTSFTFYLDNVHMPYTYDLPNFYIYAVRYSNWLTTSSNALIMANGGTLYQSPLQSLVASCQDNAIGVLSTYCTVIFGTSNPLLASGRIRLSLSGMTVATSKCFLYDSNGTEIVVTCSSSTDNKNVTVTMTGW